MNNKMIPVVILGAFIISLAIGLVVYSVTDYGWMIILWTTLLVFGIALIALAFASSREEGKYGPSHFAYRLAVSIILTTIGVIGMLDTFTDVSIWILVAIFLVAIALTGITIALINGKQEGQ
jgi:hypothetical protein